MPRNQPSNRTSSNVHLVDDVHNISGDGPSSALRELTPAQIHRLGFIPPSSFDHALPPSLDTHALAADKLRAAALAAANSTSSTPSIVTPDHGFLASRGNDPQSAAGDGRTCVLTIGKGDCGTRAGAELQGRAGHVAAADIDGGVGGSGVGSLFKWTPSPFANGDIAAPLSMAAAVPEGGLAVSQLDNGGAVDVSVANAGEDNGGSCGGCGSVLRLLLALSLGSDPRDGVEVAKQGDGVPLPLNGKTSGDVAAEADEIAAVWAIGKGSFVEAYAAELVRVRHFIRTALHDLAARLAGAAERLQTARATAAAASGAQVTAATAAAAGSGGGGGSGTAHSVAAAQLQEVHSQLRQECEQIGAQLVDIEAFERFNTAEFADIGMMYDRAIAGPVAATTNIAAGSAFASPAGAVAAAAAAFDPNNGPSVAVGAPLSTATSGPSGGTQRCVALVPSEDTIALVEMFCVYQRCVREYLLGGLTYDMVLVGLSDMHGAVRHGISGEERWVPPDQFKRSTTKYWVHPRNVLQVKTMIIRHLPVLILGRKSNLNQPAAAAPSTDTPTAPSSAVQTPQKPAQGSTSDRPSFSPLAKGAFPVLTPPPQPSTAPALPAAAAALPAALLYGPLAPLMMHDSSGVASVYFDNPKLDVYHERLVRGDGASLVRIRWYGTDSPTPDQAAFVERKKHRDAWTGECSLKERSQLKARDVPAYLGGRMLPELQSATHGTTSTPPDKNIAKEVKAATLLREVQADLIHRAQEPFLRTAYCRTAFQLSSTNAVRISLDTQLTMTREKDAQRPPGGWCRDSSLPVHRDDIVRFPYAVLEIKLQDEDSCPAWVLALQNSGLLVQAPKFSKFLHGMALLYPDKLRNTPHWFLPDTSPGGQQSANQSHMPYGGGGADGDGSRAKSVRWGVGGLFASARRDRNGQGCGRNGGGGGGAGGGLRTWLSCGHTGPPAMSPAILEELADTGDKYAKGVPSWLFPENIRPDQLQEIIPDPEPDAVVGGISVTATGGGPAVGAGAGAAAALCRDDLKAAVPAGHPTSLPLAPQPHLEPYRSPSQPQLQQQGQFPELTAGPISDGLRTNSADAHSEADDASAAGDLSKKIMNSSNCSDDCSRPSSVRSSFVPTVEAHSLVTRGSSLASPPPPPPVNTDSHLDAFQREGGGHSRGNSKASSGGPAFSALAPSIATERSQVVLLLSHTASSKPPGSSSSANSKNGNGNGNDAINGGTNEDAHGDGGKAAGMKRGSSKFRAMVVAKLKSLKKRGSGSGKHGGGSGGDLEMGGGSAFALPRAAALVRTRVEPKTFFAAERTFLSWLNIAVLVMFTSLSLMAERITLFGVQSGGATAALDGANSGARSTSQIAGMTMAPVALAFMLYALYMYRTRSAQILRRETVRFDDQRGPVVLTCLLMTVLVITYVLTIKATT